MREKLINQCSSFLGEGEALPLSRPPPGPAGATSRVHSASVLMIFMKETSTFFAISEAMRKSHLDHAQKRAAHCDNIDAEEYVEITESGGCVTIKGLAEGTGPDNPRLWDDVWMTPAAQNSCADYDKCPASGTSGFCRGPGDKMCDIIQCPGQTSTKAGAGLYSSSSRLTQRAGYAG